ncbi:hypothetical protein C8Q72DRAFT_891980 [Fomitopsis betulina]|nr:hypothetical protein C8Q72DRAFT_891980 [Fomitopsis betulina]
MPSYRASVSPLSGGPPWGTSPTTVAAAAPSLHGPRAPRRSLHAAPQPRSRSTGPSRPQLCTTLRPLPAPPPSTPVTPRTSYRPLPRPPTHPPHPPTPSASGTLRPPVPTKALAGTPQQPLYLDIPDSPKPAIIIISPLSYSGSDIPSPSVHDSPSPEEQVRIYESRRWRPPSTYGDPDLPHARRPTLPRIDAGADDDLHKPLAIQQLVLSPIEKYYDRDSAAFPDLDSHPLPPCPRNESFIVDVPLAGPPSPRKKGHLASDLSKKLKRRSVKWIREKKGKRWVEDDYGHVLQKLRRLK